MAICRRLASALLCASLISVSLQAGIAQTRPRDIQWSGTAGGERIEIPNGKMPTIMVFVRAGQSQSDEALAQFPKLLAPRAAMQVVIVYSGPEAPQQVKHIPVDKLAYMAVADADYALSGKMGVHAWPTTVMVNGKGDVMAHIAGVSPSYALEFSSYLEYLMAEIDRATLDAKLSDRTVVADNPSQAAGRHLQMASQLLAKGRVDEAQTEITAGLKLQPDDPHLKLSLVRVLVLKGQVEEAAKTLDSVKPGSVSATQLALARGRVLAAKGEIAPAIEALLESLKLNPQPAEAQYELGLIYRKQGQWEKSAGAFRAAYESRH